MSKKIKVKVPTIYMQGGLFSGVEGFPPNFRFDIVDYDTEGTDELCNCPVGEEEHYHSRRKTNKEGKE